MAFCPFPSLLSSNVLWIVAGSEGRGAQPQLSLCEPTQRPTFSLAPESPVGAHTQGRYVVLACRTMVSTKTSAELVGHELRLCPKVDCGVSPHSALPRPIKILIPPIFLQNTGTNIPPPFCSLAVIVFSFRSRVTLLRRNSKVTTYRTPAKISKTAPNDSDPSLTSLTLSHLRQRPF